MSSCSTTNSALHAWSCAACVDEVSGQRTLRPDQVAQGVTAVSVHPVGRYALQIVWSDGHDTGLYGFEYLRKLARPSNRAVPSRTFKYAV